MNKYTSVILLLVFLFFSNSLFSAPGDLIWKTRISDYYSPTSPVVASDLSEKMVFTINKKNYALYAVNAVNGQVKWGMIKDWNVEVEPYYKNGVLYYGGVEEGNDSILSLWAINAANGKIIWNYLEELKHISIFNATYCYEGCVYVYASGSGLHCFNAANGQVIWNNADGSGDKLRPEVYDYYYLGQGTSTGAFSQPYRDTSSSIHIVYSGSGYLNAYDRYTGRKLWRKEYNFTEGNMVIKNDKIYFSKDNAIYSVKPLDGSLIWKVDLSGVYPSPCWHNNRIFAGSKHNSYLHCLNAENGSIVWKSLLGNPSYSSPCAANETVYIGSDFGYLHAINANDGVRRWIFKADAEIRTTPCIEDSIIYFGCEDGFLYAVNIGEKKGFEENQSSQQLPSPSLSAYPNPFKDRLNIETTDKARIYSITGQLIMNLSKGKHSVNTSSWKQGVYIVKSGKEHKRVVKIE